jgi:hypothetical protein
MLVDFLGLPSLQLRGRNRFLDALDSCARRHVTFADAFLAAAMQVRGVTGIHAWDG